mgnify:CR=1 FL=1
MEDSNSNEKIDYCSKCGTPMPKDAIFCESCGAPRKQGEITYVKSQGGASNGWKAVAIIIGGLLIMGSIPFLFGGGALMGVIEWLDQGGGYIGVDNVDLETSTQLLVGKELDVYMDDMDGPPHWMWEPDLEDFVTLKIKAESNTGEPVFIGIVDASDAYDLFGNAAYDQVTEFRMEEFRDRYPYIEYRYHAGQTLNITPTDLDIWVTEVSGAGEQTLTWTPESGNFWLVIMNADGSANVDVEIGVGAKVPILSSIGRGLFVGGLVLLAAGVAIVYFGAIKPGNRRI